MKIVHLTSVHPPFDSRIFFKECVTAARAGHDVVLVAPTECDQVREGVRVCAVPIPRSRAARIRSTLRHVYAKAIRERADIYHFHDPELLLVAVVLKLRGHRVVYDVHEDLPRQIEAKQWIAKGLRRPVALLVEWVERGIARLCDGIVGATPTITQRFNHPRGQTIQNFPEMSEWSSGGSSAYTERPPIVAYVGGVSEMRGARLMAAAAQRLPKSLDARVVVAGRCSPPELESELKRSIEAGRMNFLGWQSRKEVADLLQSARAGLVVLLPTRAYRESYPIKLFEYMAAGLPVIASDFPLWRTIVEGAGCGLLVDPLDPEALADAITWLLTNPDAANEMGKRGRRAVETHYNWTSEARKLLTLYGQLGDDLERRGRGRNVHVAKGEP